MLVYQQALKEDQISPHHWTSRWIFDIGVAEMINSEIWMPNPCFLAPFTISSELGVVHNFETPPFDVPTEYLRLFQHTPGTYPRPRTNSLWRNSFHLGVWGGLGYAPGVCWGSLREHDENGMRWWDSDVFLWLMFECLAALGSSVAHVTVGAHGSTGKSQEGSKGKWKWAGSLTMMKKHNNSNSNDNMMTMKNKKNKKKKMMMMKKKKKKKKKNVMMSKLFSWTSSNQSPYL